MKLINIGFGNMVAASRVLAVISPESAPIKRVISDVRERGQLIDATYGRRTRAVIIMDTGHVILSALTDVADDPLDRRALRADDRQDPGGRDHIAETDIDKLHMRRPSFDILNLLPDLLDLAFQFDHDLRNRAVIAF